jgi:hypothetical protein
MQNEATSSTRAVRCVHRLGLPRRQDAPARRRRRCRDAVRRGDTGATPRGARPQLPRSSGQPSVRDSARPAANTFDREGSAPTSTVRRRSASRSSDGSPSAAAGDPIRTPPSVRAGLVRSSTTPATYSDAQARSRRRSASTLLRRGPPHKLFRLLAARAAGAPLVGSIPTTRGDTQFRSMVQLKFKGSSAAAGGGRGTLWDAEEHREVKGRSPGSPCQCAEFVDIPPNSRRCSSG